MSSTNKTPNYDLSQFTGSDKPAWLNDYNQDMTKIDTGIKSASDTAIGADGKATANAGKIGELENLTTSTKTSVVASINEVDGHADTAQETANNAVTSANKNRQSIDAIKSYFTLSQEANLTVTSSAGTAGTVELKVRKNSEGSLFKFYGRVNVANIGGSGLLTITTSDTGLRPASDIVVAGGGIRWQVEPKETRWQTYTIHPDGTITFVLTRSTTLNNVEFYFFADLTFLENFNDPVS